MMSSRSFLAPKKQTAMELPPLIEVSIQQALARSSLFKGCLVYGLSLPMPSFPNERHPEPFLACDTYSNPTIADLSRKHDSFSHEQARSANLLVGRVSFNRCAASAQNSVAIANEKKDQSNDIKSSSACSDKKRKRIILSPQQAREIYSIRPSETDLFSFNWSPSAKSRLVGRRYGVSAKTVRDIWKGLTWSNATK